MIIQQSKKTIRITYENGVKNEYYTHFQYPAGEIDLRLSESLLKELDYSDILTIDLVARIRSPYDLILVKMLYSLLEVETTAPRFDLNLILPYLPYSRADRQFVKGGNFGLDDFVSLFPDYMFIKTFDKHSDVCSSTFENVPPTKLINEVILKFLNEFGNITTKFSILFPDKGAKDRYGSDLSSFDIPIGKAFPQYHTSVPYIFYCEKKRNVNTGKFEGFVVPPNLPDIPTIIIDDLCDGGGTFNGIAELLPDYLKDKLSLYVSHGIFSKGLDELSKNFRKIYTTNSFRTEFESHPQLEVFHVEKYLS